MALGAGQYRNLVTFERRVPGTDDGFGNVVPEAWTEVATVRAAFRPEFARERMQAGKMEATSAGVLTVRRSTLTLTIGGDSRVRFVAGAYSGRIAQIRSIIPSPDSREIEFVIEEGVAT
jgi:head-tail adaptor